MRSWRRSVVPVALSLVSCLALALMALTGCPKSNDGTPATTQAIAPPPKASFVPDSPELIARNNEGVGLMGMFKYVPARDVFRKLAEEHPDWHDVQVNFAIAQHHASEASAESLEVVDRVLAADPRHIRARYCRAYFLEQAAKLDEALPDFKAVAEADATDGVAAYFVGKCLAERDQHAEAIEWFKTAIEREPFLKSSYYGASTSLKQLGHREESMEYLEQFQKIVASQRAYEIKYPYLRTGKNSECVTLDLPGAKSLDPPKGAAFDAPSPLPADEPLPEGWSWEASESSRPTSLTACDFDGDCRPELFAASVLIHAGELKNAVLRPGDDGSYRVDVEHALVGIGGINAALWGDVDNDGLVDVYLCREGANQLWRQVEAGKWEDATAATQTGGEDLNTIDGAQFDADHDSDLDILAIRADGPTELFSNNGDGTFRPLAAEYGLAGDGSPAAGVVVADLDRDRDHDLIVLKRQPPHEIWINDRNWSYRPGEGFDDFKAAPIHAAVAGDVDVDGQVDLFSAGPDELKRWAPNADGLWTSTAIDDAASTDRTQLALADFNGDGHLELLTNNAASLRVVPLGAGVGETLDAKGLLGWSPVVFHAAYGPAIVGVRATDPPLVWEPGEGRYDFTAIVPTGTQTSKSPIRRSNGSGIGIETVVRIDSMWTAISNLRSVSGPGQSLQPISIGTAGKKQIDFVGLEWSDGVFQAETSLDSSKLHRVAEIDRMPSSCPILFVWNGERYEFVADLLGKGGIGFLVAPGVYSPEDPRENLLLAEGLPVPEGERLKLKLSEPMQETTYLDRVGLTTYDLPPGWQMVLDERFVVSGPPATGEPFFYRHSIEPARVVNDRGEDVTDRVREADLAAAEPGALDGRFIGRCEPHSLVISFDEPLDASSGRPVLAARGWIEYPFSQTVFAAWQAGADYRAPTIEARAGDGPWQLVLSEFGYPAGMPREMAVPLDNLPPGATELRISTNMEVYWDRLAIVYSEPCPEATSRPLDLLVAELQPGGFPRRTVGPQRQPNFDYDDRPPLGDARHQAGFYTVFGPVAELVTEADDALAVFGSGEELHLEFAEPAEPPAAGWTRRLVLETAGWCKDADLYTKDGDTVGPLPTNGQPSAVREPLHARYNTRYEQGW